jgi:amidophosphoribosyltransferase
MSIAFNGALINGAELRKYFELKGGIFHSTGDTEAIAYAVTEQRINNPSIQIALEQAMYKLKGAYSMAIMSARKLIAARDPNGFRPLCIGELPEDKGWVVASETCALNSIGANFVRDVLPGEIVVIKDSGITSIKTHCEKNTQQKSSLCIFEYIYVARQYVRECSWRRNTPLKPTLSSESPIRDLTRHWDTRASRESPTASAS